VTLSFVLAKFAWKPLLTALKEREDKINKSLDDADEAKLELEKINKQSEEIILKAKTDALEIHSEAKAIAEKVKSEIIEKANGEVKILRDKAQKQINVEKDKALNDIRKEVVGLSMVVAEKLIKKNLSENDNEKLINETLKTLKGYEA
jgi:F-type H+-transporting ATPase subunit b